jgi:hypothetical protein
MKKLMAVAVAGVLGFAMNAGAADVVKDDVKTKGGTTVEKQEVKAGDAKIERTTTTTTGMTTTDTKVKGPAGKLEATKTETPQGASGDLKFTSKNGIVKKYDIAWKYFQKGTEYIIEYTVKDKVNDAFVKDLGASAGAVKAGTYTITSTSPYTIKDEEADLAALILKNRQTAIKK